MLSGSQLLAPNDALGLIIRLSFALFFGALIGWERERQGRAAGLRTHLLVSLSSALLVLIPIQLVIAQEFPDTIAIWLSLALGIVAACGLWELGLISVLMVWLILRIFKKFE